MRRVFASLLVAVLVASPALAQRASNVTGANLLSFCTDRHFARVENCEAYLNGVADTFAGFMKFGPRDRNGKPLAAMICISPKVTGRDLRLAVIHGLQADPSLQSRQAVEAVERIFHKTYPCH